MEVILKQEVNNLGHADEIVKVKAGYGRNYLIPKGYAVLATEINKKIHTEDVKQKAHKIEKIRKEAMSIADVLSTALLRIGAKVGTSGKIFGSVNSIQISEAIKNQFNYEIDRKKIIIKDEHIKEVGTYVAKVNLHKDVSVNVNFEVVAE